MSLYLPDIDEERLGLRFRRPQKKEMDNITNTLLTAADYLGVENVPEVQPPERGFLVESLQQNQRHEINALLAASYARQNAAHQKTLKRVPLIECSERMISLQEEFANADLDVSFSDQPFHRACGNFAGKERMWYAREGVVAKLVAALRVFNHLGMRPHLEDAFRPPAVQEGLLVRRIADVAQHPEHWNARTIQMISKSLTAPSPGLAGHQAGAAIDFRLKDRDTDQFLDLGNRYTEGSVISGINFPYVTAEQFRTRMLFANIMRMAHFKLLPTENWHVSHGDRGLGIDGPVHIHSAIYGPILDFDRETGKIQSYDPQNINKPYFTDQEIKQFIALVRRMDSEGDYVVTALEATEALEFSALGLSNELPLEHCQESDEDGTDE